MKKYLHLDSEKNVIFESGKNIGQFLQDVDGYYKFFPDLGGGYWSGYILREIADIEDSINKEWDESINRYFEREQC